MQYLKKNLVLVIASAVIGAVLGSLVVSFLSGKTFGVTDLTTITNRWTFSDDVTFNDPVVITDTTNVQAFEQGGTVVATTTTSASFGTLTEAQMIAASLFTLTPNIPSATATLPAASTFTTLINAAGDTRSWTFVNATSTAGVTVGIAAGSGINIYSNTLNNVQIAPGGAARLTCSTRTAATTVDCLFDILVAGD